MNVTVAPQDETLSARAGRVAAIAAKHADEVDVTGRFPQEAVDTLRQERLLGIQVPASLGGEGTSLHEIADICARLGQACSATAMIFAMHHIKLSSLVEHGEASAWHAGFMSRVAAEQLLLGSATTEGGIGGNLRNSICAIEVEGDFCRLEKDATVISYGSNADAILITSRTHKDAAPADQVMTVFLKNQYTLEKTHVWDTLGMRGTCSDGFVSRRSAGGTDFPEAFRGNRSAIHACKLASPVERRLVWHRVGCRAARAVFRQSRSAQVARHGSSRRDPPCGGFHQAAGGEIQHHRRHQGLRGYQERPGKTDVDGLCRRDEQCEDLLFGNHS